MSVSDPIADMLTRIRNTTMIQHRQVVMPSSKLREEIARILKEEGFIQDYEVIPAKPQAMLRLSLKYTRARRPKPVISGLKRVSKPGRRVYCGRRNLPWVRSGLGISIVSTPKGLMTGQQARRQGVGGEVLCYVW
ncbi:MAG: 30S ribosomal protein S8 [Anaerolineales bacterium]|nr:MAG: 30S ribosomal protein S8 [Anaerolineales bacterium]